MKKIAIHQPQYLPWIPYFDKALQADEFVILDHVQFQKNGLQNRNKIKTQQGAIWLTLPVNQQLGQSLLATQLATPAVLRKHAKTIEQSYRKAAYFDEVYPLFEAVWKADTSSLVSIATDLIRVQLRYLSYPGSILLSSEMQLGDKKAHDLVLEICRQRACTTYLSGQGGRAYLEEAEFAAAGIALEYQTYENQPYRQCFPQLGFIPHLSMIDLLFNEGPHSKGILLKGRKVKLS